MGEDKKYSVILDNPVAASGINIMSGVVDSAKKLPDDNIATGTARLGSMAVRTVAGVPLAAGGIVGGTAVRAGQPVGDVVGAAATSVVEFTDNRIEGSKERFSALKDSVIDNTKERSVVERIIGGIGSTIGLAINGTLALVGMPVKAAYAVGDSAGKLVEKDQSDQQPVQLKRSEMEYAVKNAGFKGIEEAMGALKRYGVSESKGTDSYFLTQKAVEMLANKVNTRQ